MQAVDPCWPTSPGLRMEVLETAKKPNLGRFVLKWRPQIHRLVFRGVFGRKGE